MADSQFKNVLGFVAAFALPIVGVGCAADDAGDDLDGFDQDRIIEISSESTCVTLIAGKKANAGTVCTSIDNTVDTSAQCGEGAAGVMNVTFETTGPWELVKARIGVGRGMEDIPTTRRGRVKKNQLPYQSGDIEGATSHSFAVPLCELGLDASDTECDPLKSHVVAHARVRKQKRNGTYRYKGAWADGISLGRRRRWGKFFTMELTCSEGEAPPPPEAQCETAFAAGPGATCFLGADFDGDGVDDGHGNWGWTNGPVAPGTSTQWPVYASVGGCDPSQGQHVGNLGISYDGANATVVFDRVGEITLDEEQLYIGSEALARDADGEFTVTPSDFPIAVDLEDATQTTHTVSGLSGDVHVVYHAVACGDGLEPNPDPLSVLTDEFLTDGDLSGWSIHEPNTAEVTVEDGALIIEPFGNTQWYATDEAMQVYKTVAGDFSVSAHIQVTNLAGEPAAPGDPYRIGGIMVRDPASELPNTYHMGIGNMNQPEVVTVSKSTDEGSSSIGTQPWGGTTAEMRICRVGTEIQSFIRLDDDEGWRLLDHRVRGDLPSTLAVGAIGYAGTPVPDLHVEADWMQFQTITKLEDCYRD